MLVLPLSQESCHCLKEKVLPPSFSGCSLPLFLSWVKWNGQCHYHGLHQICLVANIFQLERQNPKTGGCPFLGKKARDPGRCPELYWTMAAMLGPSPSPGSALSQSHSTFRPCFLHSQCSFTWGNQGRMRSSPSPEQHLSGSRRARAAAGPWTDSHSSGQGHSRSFPSSSHRLLGSFSRQP